jgi:hypothetical protein
MEIMIDFIKKHFHGRIYRKPRDIDEFVEDIGYYFLMVNRKSIHEYEKRDYIRHGN